MAIFIHVIYQNAASAKVTASWKRFSHSFKPLTGALVLSITLICIFFAWDLKHFNVSSKFLT